MVSIDGGDSALVSNLSLNWMRRVMFGDERLVFFSIGATTRQTTPANNIFPFAARFVRLRFPAGDQFPVHYLPAGLSAFAEVWVRGF